MASSSTILYYLSLDREEGPRRRAVARQAPCGKDQARCVVNGIHPHHHASNRSGFLFPCCLCGRPAQGPGGEREEQLQFLRGRATVANSPALGQGRISGDPDGDGYTTNDCAPSEPTIHPAPRTSPTRASSTATATDSTVTSRGPCSCRDSGQTSNRAASRRFLAQRFNRGCPPRRSPGQGQCLRRWRRLRGIRDGFRHQRLRRVRSELPAGSGSRNGHANGRRARGPRSGQRRDPDGRSSWHHRRDDAGRSHPAGRHASASGKSSYVIHAQSATLALTRCHSCRRRGARGRTAAQATPVRLGPTAPPEVTAERAGRASPAVLVATGTRCHRACPGNPGQNGHTIGGAGASGTGGSGGSAGRPLYGLIVKRRVGARQRDAGPAGQRWH